MSIIIGADIGTSNIKVIAFKKDNEVFASEHAACPMLQSAPERMEQDPTAIFLLVNQLLKKVLVRLKGEQIEGICFSTAMHSIIALDEQNKPLTPAILWGDTRSASQCADLKEREMEKILYPQTGVPLHPALPLCKIMWLKENAPDIFKLAHKFISLKEYFFLQWFGKYVVDHSIAGATGMLDIHQLQWSKTALQIAGIKENQLSQIVPVTHVETQLVDAFSDFFQISHVPFIIGSSDGCLANTGSGVFKEDEAALTIGTSGAVRTTVTIPSLNEPTLFCYPILKDVFIKGGAVNNGGNVLKWFATCFLNLDSPSEKDYTRLVEEAHSVDPGAEGLLFLPYLQGERAPIWNAAAKGVFFGISQAHRRPHFTRALLEGICYGLYDIYCVLTQRNDPISIIYASGGFTQNRLWVQMISDIFNKKVVINNQADASATGAALLGWYAIGASKTFALTANSESGQDIFFPDTEKHRMYMEHFSIFRSLYRALEKEFPKLQTR